MIRVALPYPLRLLADAGAEVRLNVPEPVTVQSVLDALESEYPILRGTIRDPVTGHRRPFLRFYACQQDLSHQPHETPVPGAVAAGQEPFLIIGAISGG